MNKGMLLRKFYKLKILKQTTEQKSTSCDDMLWIYRFQSNITLSIWPALLMDRIIMKNDEIRRRPHFKL